MATDAQWIDVMGVDELAEGQMQAFSHGERRLLLVRSGGRWYAIDEMCSHEDYSLALGCVHDGKVRCSLHGSDFDLASGAALAEPADEPLCTYPVETRAGRVWVNAAPR